MWDICPWHKERKEGRWLLFYLPRSLFAGSRIEEEEGYNEEEKSYVKQGEEALQRAISILSEPDGWTIETVAVSKEMRVTGQICGSCYLSNNKRDSSPQNPSVVFSLTYLSRVLWNVLLSFRDICCRVCLSANITGLEGTLQVGLKLAELFHVGVLLRAAQHRRKHASTYRPKASLLS